VVMRTTKLTKAEKHVGWLKVILSSMSDKVEKFRLELDELEAELAEHPPKKKREWWDGMATCGIHGADFKGQVCRLCQPLKRKAKR